jgi:hypothetical protein
MAGAFFFRIEFTGNVECFNIAIVKRASQLDNVRAADRRRRVKLAKEFMAKPHGGGVKNFTAAGKPPGYRSPLLEIVGVGCRAYIVLT